MTDHHVGGAEHTVRSKRGRIADLMRAQFREVTAEREDVDDRDLEVGRVIEVGNKPDKLKQAFDQIGQELRSQYNIGYTPSNSHRDGSFRKIEIRAKGGEYKIQARSGYYAMPRKDQ